MAATALTHGIQNVGCDYGVEMSSDPSYARFRRETRQLVTSRFSFILISCRGDKLSCLPSEPGFNDHAGSEAARALSDQPLVQQWVNSLGLTSASFRGCLKLQPRIPLGSIQGISKCLIPCSICWYRMYYLFLKCFLILATFSNFRVKFEENLSIFCSFSYKTFLEFGKRALLHFRPRRVYLKGRKLRV